MAGFMKTLKTIFDECDISVKEFAELTKISIPRVYAYLNRSLDTFKEFEVAMLTNLLPIDPAFFGMNNDIFRYRDRGVPNTLISYEQLKNQGKISHYSEFLIKYFERLITEVKKAKKSIVVLDYVGDNPFPAQKAKKDDTEQNIFHKLYESFLDEVTKFVLRVQKKKGVDAYPAYIRILQCPIGNAHPTLNFEDKRNVAMDLSYNDMFCQLESLTNSGLNKYAEIYWVKNAFRPYSTMIIDDKMVITEQVKFNLRGEPMPDMLFFDHVVKGDKNSIAQTLLQTYQVDIDSVLNDPSHRIIRGDALLSLRTILARYEEEIPIAKKELEEKEAELSELEKKTESVSSDKIPSLWDAIKHLKVKVKKLKERHLLLKDRKELTERKIGNFIKSEGDKP